MLFRNNLIIALRRSKIARRSFELLSKRLVIEEDPRILPKSDSIPFPGNNVPTYLILPIPPKLQLPHTLHHTLQLRIPHQTNQRCSRPSIPTQRRKMYTLRDRIFVVGVLFKPSYWIRSLLLAIFGEVGASRSKGTQGMDICYGQALIRTAR